MRNCRSVSPWLRQVLLQCSYSLLVLPKPSVLPPFLASDELSPNYAFAFLPQDLGSPVEAVEPEEWPSALLKPFTPQEGGSGNGGSLYPRLFSVKANSRSRTLKKRWLKVEKYLGQPSNWHWSGSPSVCFQQSHHVQCGPHCQQRCFTVAVPLGVTG